MEFFGLRTRRERPVEPAAQPDPAALEREYLRGRRDERRHRRRSPVLGALLAATALVGAANLALAAREGSFARGGEVVDRELSIAAGQAQLSGRDAALAGGEAARDAGHTLWNRLAADRAG